MGNNGTTYHQKKSGKKTKKKKKSDQPPYFKLSHTVISSPDFIHMPLSAQCLFVHLCRLRNQLTNGKNRTPERWFWRTNEKLMEETDLSYGALVTARQTLVQRNFVLLKTENQRVFYMVLDDVYQKEHNEYREKDPPRTQKPVDISDVELPNAPSEIPF